MSEIPRRLPSGHGTGADFHALILREGRWRWAVCVYAGDNWWSSGYWTRRAAERSARRWIRRQRRQQDWEKAVAVLT